MTEIKPFSLNFQPDSTIFVIDEFSQHKSALLNEYCYSDSPIVINDINQLISQEIPANRKLVLDCVLKWDDMWQYNYVADMLLTRNSGLLMFMSKPVAFDKMIRAKADYLILFRGRNIRYMRKIYRQYLTQYISDPIELINKFKNLSWGHGLVLDLAGMAETGRFEGNYYSYDSHTTESSTSSLNHQQNVEYTSLDTTISNWVAEFKDADTNWEVISGPDHIPSSSASESASLETSEQPRIPELPEKTNESVVVDENKPQEQNNQGWFSYLFGWASFTSNSK